jgi:hypothetical protein
MGRGVVSKDRIIMVRKPRVMISARDLNDIISDELCGIEYIPGVTFLSPREVRKIAKTIVNKALLSP